MAVISQKNVTLVGTVLKIDTDVFKLMLPIVSLEIHLRFLMKLRIYELLMKTGFAP